MAAQDGTHVGQDGTHVGDQGLFVHSSVIQREGLESLKIVIQNSGFTGKVVIGMDTEALAFYGSDNTSDQNESANIGEGGHQKYAVIVQENKDSLDLLKIAMENAGITKNVFIGVDVAASEFNGADKTDDLNLKEEDLFVDKHVVSSNSNAGLLSEVNSELVDFKKAVDSLSDLVKYMKTPTTPLLYCGGLLATAGEHLQRVGEPITIVGKLIAFAGLSIERLDEYAGFRVGDVVPGLSVDAFPPGD